MKIWTVDAFTDQPFRGNPAAVTIVKDFPKDEICLAIASEMNLSETAFIKPLAEDYYQIRWFTPVTEVRLCGHATLASAHLLFSEGFIKGERISFESLSGLLNVTKEEKGRYTLNFPLQPIDKPLPLDRFKAIFGPTVLNAVQAFDDVLVELDDVQSLRRSAYDLSKIATIEARGVTLTAAGDQGYDFVSRFFAPRIGVPEDPVTGSAHCKLADYWQKKLGKSTFRAFQASKRGGEIEISIRDKRVLLTGSAKTILESHLTVDLQSLETLSSDLTM